MRRRTRGKSSLVYGAVALCAALWCGLGFADSVPPPDQAPLTAGPTDPVFEARLKHLETELRCLVCQNQTLADSGAGLAEDLRREVRGLAASGKSDEEIKQYLHDRYGNFIFYRPPVEPDTWLLWFGPFIALMGTAAWLILRIRRQAKSGAPAPSPVSESERRRIEALLGKPE